MYNCSLCVSFRANYYVSQVLGGAILVISGALVVFWLNFARYCMFFPYSIGIAKLMSVLADLVVHYYETLTPNFMV